MKFPNLLRLAPALAILSCAAPKATVVEQAPVPKKKSQSVAANAQDALPDFSDDGLRLPDMLELPGDGEFRATSPVAEKPPAGSGGVIARPPTDPPSRPKPPDAVVPSDP